jgi:solute carrier family 35 protein F5
MFTRKYILGIVFIVLVAILWSLASVITQFIYVNENFQSPVLLTYISSSLFSVYLVLWQVLLKTGYAQDRRKTLASNEKRDITLYNPLVNNDSSLNLEVDSNDSSTDLIESPYSEYNYDNNDNNDNNNINDDNNKIEQSSFQSIQMIKNFFLPIPENYTHQQIIYAALILFPIWFVSNCFYDYSLLLTSITSSTIISNLSGIFTLYFSWLFGIENVTKEKVIGLFICMCAVILIALKDKRSNIENNHSFTGDFLTLLGAAGYGLYTTILRIKVTDDETVPMQLVLGYMGLTTAIICSPILLIMSMTRFGGFDQMTLSVFGFVLLNGILDNVIADYLWARAVLLTSPTIATVGLSLTIPFAILCDFITKGEFSFLSFLGAMLFIVGFIILNIDFEEWSNYFGNRKNENENKNVTISVPRNNTVEI